MTDDSQLNGKLSIVETGITSLNISVQYDIVQLILYNFMYCTTFLSLCNVQYMKLYNINCTMSYCTGMFKLVIPVSTIANFPLS